MIITVLGSGSKGNSTLIETKDKKILIDVGLPLSNLEKRLGRKMPKLDLVIITHTHNDHIKGLKSLIKKQNPIIYTIKNDLEEKTNNYKNIYYLKELELDKIKINLFEVSHDVPCLGINIKENDKELVYITDTGYIKTQLLDEYKNKDIYILESNYDQDMLMEGSYPFYLKQRIRSDKGHLSNNDTCRYLKTLIGSKTKYICLAHLSEENNDQNIVKQKTKETIEKIDNNIEEVIICSQTEPIKIEI